MPSEKIAGTAYIKYDGAQLSLSGTLTVSLDTVEREGLAGLSGPAGYKETPRVPFIEAEVFGDSDWDPAALDLITDAEELARVQTGNEIARHVTRAETERQGERDGEPAQKDEHHRPHDLRVDLKLRDGHDEDDEENQRGDNSAQKRRELDARILRSARHGPCQELRDHHPEKQHEERGYEIRQIREK